LFVNKHVNLALLFVDGQLPPRHFRRFSFNLSFIKKLKKKLELFQKRKKKSLNPKIGSRFQKKSQYGFDSQMNLEPNPRSKKEKNP
jgi:hypothetical protein